MIHTDTSLELTIKSTYPPLSYNVSPDYQRKNFVRLLPPTPNLNKDYANSQPLVLVSTVFAKIHEAIKQPHGPTSLPTSPHPPSNLPIEPNTNGLEQLQLTATCNSKRSARLRAKKVKTLGLIENSLNEADIFFINSLTNAELIKLGTQCGIILNQSNQITATDKLRKMELHRCKKPVVSTCT